MTMYGHLRPGTYDILSHRYDQMSDLAMNTGPVRAEPEHTDFEMEPEKLRLIDGILEEEGFPEVEASMLLEYVRSAIVGREYGKFVFTRSINEML